MTATAHALIGASLAAKITNPIIGIPLAVFSHFAADLIPHWDAGTNHKKKTQRRYVMEAAADVLLGFALVFLLFRNTANPTYLWTMVISAQLPDWIESPSSILGFHIPPFSWMDWVGHNLQSRMQLPWGLVTQIVTVAVFLIWGLSSSIPHSTFASLFY